MKRGPSAKKLQKTGVNYIIRNSPALKCLKQTRPLLPAVAEAAGDVF